MGEHTRAPTLDECAQTQHGHSSPRGWLGPSHLYHYHSGLGRWGLGVGSRKVGPGLALLELIEAEQVPADESDVNVI